MKNTCFIFIFSLLGLYPAPAQGQQKYIYNYNIYSGLPSNYLYGAITDHYGYLWFGTTKGVIRFNGYEFKVFTTADGLPTSDVWQIFEDNAGRVWLGNSTNEIGYILNDRYHKVYSHGSVSSLYTRDITKYGDGVTFFNDLGLPLSRMPVVFFSGGDTLFHYSLPIGIKNRYTPVPDSALYSDESLGRVYVTIEDSNKLSLIYRGDLYSFFPKRSKDSVFFMNTIDRDFFLKNIVNNTAIRLDSYTIYYSVPKPDCKVSVLNMHNGATAVIDLAQYGEKGTIEYIDLDHDRRKYFVITTYRVYQFGFQNGGRLEHIDEINAIVGHATVNGNKIKHVTRDTAWGTIVGTTTSGFANVLNAVNHFTPVEDSHFKESSCIAGKADEFLGFWNNDKRELAIETQDGVSRVFHLKNTSILRDVVSYGEDTLLAIGNTIHLLMPAAGHFFLYDSSHSTMSGYSAVRLQDKNLLTLTYSDIALTRPYSHYHKSLVGGKYGKITYDSLRKCIYISRLFSMYTYFLDSSKGHSHEDIVEYFGNYGISKLMNMTVDNRYGNLFFKGLENVTMYNKEQNKYVNLLKNVNLTDADILVYHDLFVVYGSFGVAFFKINGKMQLSDPLIYRNARKISYNVVNSCQASWGKLFLFTDKGEFQVTIPSDSEIVAQQKEPWGQYVAYTCKYADKIATLRSGDTINFSQLDRRFQFDVINPLGCGKLRFEYKFQGDSTWISMNANELNVPARFAPDEYFILQIRAYDEHWKSDVIELHMYAIPYWYQTSNGRILVWFSVGILLLVIISASILITRRVVFDIAARRSSRRELELKAMYAQINPHFIFNTLNSALLLVSKNKMDEAYAHITKFSRLLRSYLKSSRNKFITIAEEIVNLRDYIELQQIRFKNKFSYEIVISEDLNPEVIKIPSLLLQPFVENSINHGILPMESLGKLAIRISWSDETHVLTCTIEDNGIGRKQSKLLATDNQLKTESYGDLLIRDLVSIFNKYENMNIEVRYTDKLEPEAGTIVTIAIKNPVYAK